MARSSTRLPNAHAFYGRFLSPYPEPVYPALARDIMRISDDRDGRSRDASSWSAFALNHIDSITVVFTTLILTLALYIHLGVAFPLIYTEGGACRASASKHAPADTRCREARRSSPLEGLLLVAQVPHARLPQPQVRQRTAATPCCAPFNVLVFCAVSANNCINHETPTRLQRAPRRQLPVLGRKVPG